MEIIKETITEVWEASIDALLNHYINERESVITERDTTSIEIDNMVLVVTNPLKRKAISSKYPNHAYLKKYSGKALEFKYQRQINHRIIETVLPSQNKINQVDYVTQLLKQTWYSTKGIISVWDPYVDTNSNHPPCTTLMQYYIRNNALCMTDYFRSNDAWLCAYGDMLANVNLLKQIAKKLHLEVGKYTHIACCYHIYEYDIYDAMCAFSKF